MAKGLNIEDLLKEDGLSEYTREEKNGVLTKAVWKKTIGEHTVRLDVHNFSQLGRDMYDMWRIRKFIKASTPETIYPSAQEFNDIAGYGGICPDEGDFNSDTSAVTFYGYAADFTVTPTKYDKD